MKRIFLAIFFLCFTSVASARSIHVEWGYTPPTEPAVTGYRLYKNGVSVQFWPGKDTREGDTEVDPLLNGDVFTLTATFADSTESPHSAPFVWDGSTSFTLYLKSVNKPAALDGTGEAKIYNGN